MSLSRVPKENHRKPKRHLKSKLAIQELRRESSTLTSNSRKHMEFASYGEERPYNCGKNYCPVARNLRFLKEIDKHLDEIGFTEEESKSFKYGTSVLEAKYTELGENPAEIIRATFNISEEIKMLITENAGERYFVSIEEALHRNGMHITPKP